jgi:hypothetical protein
MNEYDLAMTEYLILFLLKDYKYYFTSLLYQLITKMDL